MQNSLWVALALVCIIEGLLPLLMPRQWREMFTGLLQLSDGQLRFFGLCAVLLGALGVALVD